MYFRIGRTVYPVKGILTVIGATLLLVSLALDFSYANLNTYVIAYLRSKNEKITYADWIFIATSKTIFQGFFMPFAGKLERKIGTKASIFLGCLIYTGSITLTYYALDYGLTAVVFSLSISHGIGFSLIYAQAIGAVIRWFMERNKGLMSSFAVGGYGFGAVIWIPLETAFVNPDNINATAVDPQDPNSEKYFTDPEVLSQIPSLFLLLGGIFAALQITGLFLLSEPSNSDIEESRGITNIQSSTTINAKEEEKNLTIAQTLRRQDFWLLWIIFMAIQLMNSFINSYQKSFGLIYINNDTFFSRIGLIANVLNGSCRIIWGKLYDAKGFKFNTFLIGGVSTFLTFTIILLKFIPEDDDMMGRKVFFAIWVISLYGFIPGIYASVAPVTQATFGSINYSRDFGLLFTQSIVASVVLIIGQQVLFQYINYLGMFLICGSVGLIGLAATWKLKLK